MIKHLKDAKVDIYHIIKIDGKYKLHTFTLEGFVEIPESFVRELQNEMIEACNLSESHGFTSAVRSLKRDIRNLSKLIGSKRGNVVI